MISSKIIALFVAAIVLVTMQSNSVMGRPTEEQKTKECVTSTTTTTDKPVTDNIKDKEATLNEKRRRILLLEHENSSVADNKGRSLPFNPINPDIPSRFLRKKRWDGCGYKGMC